MRVRRVGYKLAQMLPPLRFLGLSKIYGFHVLQLRIGAEVKLLQTTCVELVWFTEEKLAFR